MTNILLRRENSLILIICFFVFIASHVVFAHDGQFHAPETPIPNAEGPVVKSSALDLCESDSEKTLPGVCGCGVADTDRNRNDVFDCLSRLDTKSQIQSIITKISKVKSTSSTSARRLSKSVQRLRTFVKKWSSGIVLNDSSTDITKEEKKLRRTINSFLNAPTTKFRTKKSKATTGANNLLSKLSRYQLYFGTGEYSPRDVWDAVLRFDAADELTSGAQSTPSGTVPLKQTKDASNYNLNFGHAIYLHSARDELYVASLFTTTGDSEQCPGGTTIACGSIGVFNQASSIDGEPQLSRHIFGSATTFNQPHGIFMDEDRDILYVANTFAGNILVFDSASTANGDQAPSRTISYSSLGFPVHVFVDSASDRLFVVSMRTGITQKGGAVLIFNNASSASGSITPALRIYGTNTRLDEGNNQTTHNIWYDSTKKLMFVGHHTNEVLIFDLSSVNLDSPPSGDLDIAPRVLKINEQSDDSDQYDWSAYGLFYLASEDRLYVSGGNTVGGTPTRSGPPNSGATTHVVRVYDGISDSTKSGLVTPSKNIYWSSVTTYYPPQPLWVLSD